MQNTRLAKASEMFFDFYVPAIGTLISSFAILPYLELLDWEDKVVLPRSFFNQLASSSIKHPKLYRVQLDEVFEIELPSTLAGRHWPLETLHLELYPSLHKLGEVNTSLLCNSILALCAPTLESLTWVAMRGDGPQSTVMDRLDPPYFPKLRNLKLNNVKFSDSFILDALIRDNLRTLDANTESSADFFSKRGKVPSLETFVWHSPCIPADHPLEFLRANSQLTKLSVPFVLPEVLLETQLLPLLSKSFQRLKSLSLKWDSTSISESALEMISSLTSLEQIHLSAGEQFGWENNMLINHGTMRTYLRRLPCLRRIALSRDTYPNEQPGAPDSYYYADRFVVGAPNPLDRDTQSGLWEQKHCKHMLSEANEYARVLPKLEWLYCGQLVMGFRDISKTGERAAIALSPERDDCWTLLQDIFGLGE